MVPVVWAKTAGALRSVQAAATDAAHAWRAASGGRTLSGTAGALLFGPRVHLHGCGGERGGGGRRGRGGRAERDVALHGAAELHQVRVSGFRGEREYRGCGAVDRNAARDQVREHGERHGERLAPNASQLGQRRRRRAGAERRGRGRQLGRRSGGAEGVGRLGGLERGESRREQQRQGPPTVTTELGAPYSSSRAAGAAGSASHLTPSTRNA